MAVLFKEKDIRPFQYKEGMKTALQRDLAWLQARKDRFVEVNCPACGEKDYREAFRKYHFDFVSCNACETVFMNPRAPAQMLSEFYARSELYAFWNQYVFPASEEIRRKKIFRPRVDRILEICARNHTATNSIIEVGAGFGTFCVEMKSRGVFKEVTAVEPNGELAQSCRERGIDTFECTIEELRPERLAHKPDVVVSFEVIEHLYSPELFLRHCRKIMGKDSIIVVTCPNYKGFDIATLGTVSESIDAEHINLFNPASLQLLFRRNGFEILECFTPGEIDVDIVRNKVLEGEYNLSGQPFLKTVLMDGWPELAKRFQEFLQKNQLSSHMWLVAKRTED